MLDADPGLLHAGDESSNQPIHWAVMTRQIDMIDELLDRGADINARRRDGARPIHLSKGDYSYRGWRYVPADVATTPGEVLAHLIDRGAVVGIWTTAHLGDLNRVRELLDQDQRSQTLTQNTTPTTQAPDGAEERGGQRAHRNREASVGGRPESAREHDAPRDARYSAARGGFLRDANTLEEGRREDAGVEFRRHAESRSGAGTAMVDLLCRTVQHDRCSAHYGDLRTAAAVFTANSDRRSAALVTPRRRVTNGSSV
jgi:hypothetical protein